MERGTMTVTRLHTRRLSLIAQTVEQVRAQVAALTADQRAHLSADWLALLNDEAPDVWTLGFTVVDGTTGTIVGTCGFKGPPTADGAVEIAYGTAPEHQGHGYATEAAGALVDYAFETPLVGVVRAHTFSASNASARVLTKCGFRLVDTIDDPEDGRVWRWEKQR
jgi:RimJ/RimL family protein N-acetyltransferase